MSKNNIKLQDGTAVQFRPKETVASVVHGYLWIGNNAPNDGHCFATLTEKRRLRRLAHAILDAIGEPVKLRRRASKSK